MIDTLKRIFTGLTIPQQYVCVALEEMTRPLVVNLVLQHGLKIDVSRSHLFLGYKPLVMAMVFDEHDALSEKLLSTSTIRLEFDFQSQPGSTRPIAALNLERIDERRLGGHTVIFYKGVHGRHHFISSIHQTVNNFRERIKPSNPENVSLPGNLYDMVRIAYSLPRVISVITVSDGTLMNMFPTDLHGPVSNLFYISSLRQHGKATSQVEKFRKLCISNVRADAFRDVYALGKNHMQELKPIESFQCAPFRSKEFGIPLPMHVIGYRELLLKESFDVGIHRLHVYQIVSNLNVDEAGTLAHIHQYYAQWRMNNALPTRMLLR